MTPIVKNEESQPEELERKLRSKGVSVGQCIRATISNLRLAYFHGEAQPILFFCRSNLELHEEVGENVGEALPPVIELEAEIPEETQEYLRENPDAEASFSLEQIQIEVREDAIAITRTTEPKSKEAQEDEPARIGSPEPTAREQKKAPVPA